MVAVVIPGMVVVVVLFRCCWPDLDGEGAVLGFGSLPGRRLPVARGRHPVFFRSRNPGARAGLAPNLVRRRSVRRFGPVVSLRSVVGSWWGQAVARLVGIWLVHWALDV
uniref:Putative secreted protein n=1 Tax=Ixodes ricinus TaxID=34613 RepID=A0A6B0UHZ0_IXORI